MQLLVFITDTPDVMPYIFDSLKENNITGATMVDCEGMYKVLTNNTHEAPPIFGSLRGFLNPENVMGKMMFMAIADEKVDLVRDVIKENCKRTHHDTGVIFTLPITLFEGVN